MTGADVISTCAVGFRSNTLVDPNETFRKMILEIVNPNFAHKFRSSLLAMSPKLCIWLKIRNLVPPPVKYFISLVDENIKYREKSNVQRNDFIDLLIALKRDEEAANAKDPNRTGKIGTFDSSFFNKQSFF